MSDSQPIVEYDRRWPVHFEEEKAEILAAIGDKVVAIEHFGSTAVPGLGAKPIIDILIAVRHLDDAKECIEPLRQLGYEYRPINEILIPGTRYFRRGPSGANTHHVRMVEAESALWHEYLLFRDYLRNHPEEAKKYYELKEELHAKFGKRLPMDAKKAFIESTITRARAWENSR
ncbi:MAG TPA: GrpB family protein [Candidatus Bathyarchaeia archaeon]